MEHITIGIDQFTITIIPHETYTPYDWSNVAYDLAHDLANRVRLTEIWGNSDEMNTDLVRGYTCGIGYSDQPYLCICWNPDHPDMHLCVHFSAQALSKYMRDYKQKIGNSIIIPDILRMMQNDRVYRMRLSRIDLTADYFNYTIDESGDTYLCPHDIYKALEIDEIRIVDHNDRYNKRKLSALDIDHTIETFYVGSRKANTRSFMRVYDKRREQIQTTGTRLDDALHCQSWLRFEVVYKQTYAEQITYALLNINDTDTLTQYIAFAILEHYRFMDTGTEKYTPYTRDLMDIADGSLFAPLDSSTPRNNELYRSYLYLTQNSGLLSFLFKIEQLWGDDGLHWIFDHLKLRYECYKNSMTAGQANELVIWLRNNRDLMDMDIEEYFTRGGNSNIDLEY